MTHSLAVVTGAASGIGLALTRELAARAFEVIAIDKNPMPADLPSVVTAVQIDIRDQAAMQSLADAYQGRPVTYLFANAGIAAPGSVLGATPGHWQRAWFARYAEAQGCLRDEAGHFLLPYARQFLVVDSAFIDALGLSPSLAQWQAIGCDLVAGYGKPDWHALHYQRLRQNRFMLR